MLRGDNQFVENRPKGVICRNTSARAQRSRPISTRSNLNYLATRSLIAWGYQAPLT